MKLLKIEKNKIKNLGKGVELLLIDKSNKVTIDGKFNSLMGNFVAFDSYVRLNYCIDFDLENKKALEDIYSTLSAFKRKESQEFNLNSFNLDVYIVERE